MSLIRTLASKGSLLRSPACSTASPAASKLRSSLAMTGERLSSSLSHAAVAGPRGRVTGSMEAWGRGACGRGKDLTDIRKARLTRRDQQQSRSLGLFADGGGVSHRTLKELEKKATLAPSDASAEVVRYSITDQS